MSGEEREAYRRADAIRLLLDNSEGEPVPVRLTRMGAWRACMSLWLFLSDEERLGIIEHAEREEADDGRT